MSVSYADILSFNIDHENGPETFTVNDRSHNLDRMTRKFEGQLFVKNSSGSFERYPGNGMESCGGISGFVPNRHPNPCKTPPFFEGITGWVKMFRNAK